MDYYSMSFTTRNETGDREVEFELRRTLIDRLLRRPAKRLTFVQPTPSTVWWHKGTGKRAGTYYEMKCQEAVECFRQQEAQMEAYARRCGIA